MAADPFLQDPAPAAASRGDMGDDDGIALGELLAPIARHGWLVLLALALGGAAGYGLSHLKVPVFTSVATFLPPQAQQSSAASALASLGALSPLAGLAGGVRSPSDQYVAFMLSSTVSDRIIDRFKLDQVYQSKLRTDARAELGKNVRIGVGKKDGLIAVEVDDTDPQRAARMANQYVDELRRMTSTLAVTEAQQRRAFFEKHLETARDKLTAAQVALQSSGFNQGALRAEPKAAAEGYARLKADIVAADIRLQSLRSEFANGTPEVRRQQSVVASLRAQLAQVEQSGNSPSAGNAGNAGNSAEGPGYIGKYREFKYQETLFDLFARQYELARVDESREGALIQVIDMATPAERKSRPSRRNFAAGGAALGFLVAAVVLVVRGRRRAGVASRP